MIVKIVGGHGGVAPGFKTTSYLVDGTLLIDAGSIASGVPISEQIDIDYILISHPHFDHISDLAFISDNCFGLRTKPFEVYLNKEVKAAIKTHFMNNLLWPDFSVIPSAEKPTIRFNEIQPEVPFQLGDYKILPVQVNHSCNALGFIIEKISNDVSVVFTQDTGPTDRIWEIAHQYKNLKAIFTEVSFPNKLAKVARDSLHHTPNTITEEIKKMPPNVPIFLGHLKPHYQDQLHLEIQNIGNERISVLSSDNSNYVF